ncbi:hypothetical protein M378DRAFT_89635, partial [Amanita muscaria Koide BX008]
MCRRQSRTSVDLDRDDESDNEDRAKIKVPLLKPIEYDGSPDPLKFFRFLTQGMAYLREGKIPRESQLIRLSYFLKGKGRKAYKFYASEVEYEVEDWNLQQFFDELFNYCFPPDFRMRQMEKLNRMCQGNLRVREYAAELKLLYRTIGTISEREMVTKLWKGMHVSLQRALWKECQDPERSTWDEIVRTAERHEIADS